jgi:hypothetical protein
MISKFACHVDGWQNHTLAAAKAKPLSKTSGSCVT